MQFVDRSRECAALEAFWQDERAHFIPVIGRRRVGKTTLLEHFSQGKHVVYYRCQLADSTVQLPLLAAAMAEPLSDPLLIDHPPATWSGIFGLLARLAERQRLLLILDEIPYWVAKDESVPSILQNWWDSQGRKSNIVIVLCGSAVQMMESILTGQAPLAGCITGRLPVHQLDFRSAADLLGFRDAEHALTAYGILGGVPLYLGFFHPQRTIRQNILQTIASETARLYVEPQAVFASHHQAFNAQQALAVLRAIARNNHRWSDIQKASALSAVALERTIEPLIGDLGLVERVLPVTETKATKTYYTQYHLADNFFRFWFRFIEPNQGHIEFGDRERVVGAIMSELPDYMGPVFEAMCRDWTRLASAAGVLGTRLARVGTWWTADHQVDVVGLDDQRRVAVAGEAKWRREPFDWAELEKYLGHVRALGDMLLPAAQHVLFSKSGFRNDVLRWASQVGARTLTPGDMLAPFGAAEHGGETDA